MDYSRQIATIGEEGQRRLAHSRILVAGAGGLGSSLLPALASSGVGNITLYDPDTVSASNLSRQLLYRMKDIGRYKADAARDFLADINPDISIQAFRESFPFSGQYNLLIDATDSLPHKQKLALFAWQSNTPAILGALSPLEGNIFLQQRRAPGIPCFHCLFPEAGTTQQLRESFSEGVLSALPQFAGSAMAYYAILLLLQKPVTGNLIRITPSGARTLRQAPSQTCPYHPGTLSHRENTNQ